ncbi:hypothetical protein ACFW6X_13020 [Streptomyces bacillaris]|uniref:hypothetical protein n=1 Tax=Streptomyces bacillaris TaxID=68179 RepID=UPI003687D924
MSSSHDAKKHSWMRIPRFDYTPSSRLRFILRGGSPHRASATTLPPGQERAEVEAWLAFADAHLQNFTESASAPKLPTPPKPSGDDLKPFLGHWSPYGPRSY